MKQHEKLKYLRELKTKYSTYPIESIIKKESEKLPFKCPKCKGNGFKTNIINTYPKGLPDSDWIDRYEEIKEDCDLCNAEGYTEKEYKPQYKSVLEGYK